MKTYRLHSNPTDVHFARDITAMIRKARAEFKHGDEPIYFEDDHREGFWMSEVLLSESNMPNIGRQLAITHLIGSFCAPAWRNALYSVVNSMATELVIIKPTKGSYV